MAFYLEACSRRDCHPAHVLVLHNPRMSHRAQHAGVFLSNCQASFSFRPWWNEEVLSIDPPDTKLHFTCLALPLLHRNEFVSSTLLQRE